MVFKFPKATAKESGFKTNIFPKLEGLIYLGKFGPLDSLLVLKDGKLIFEKYFNGFNSEKNHPIQSVSKSIQSILVGICFDKGYLKSLDEPIIHFFEEYKSLDWGNKKDKISFRHLLSMTSGIQWNESEMSYQSFENQANQMVLSIDWVEYVLSQPMEAKPGKVFNYSSANPILFSSIIKKVTGQSNEVFALKHLFKPLGIRNVAFHRNIFSTGIIGDYEMTPGDLLKLGFLILKKGNWKGIKLISSGWVEQFISSQTQLNPNFKEYLFFWWRKAFLINGKKIWGIYAWGYGGQHIFLFPEMEMVIVTTGSYYHINQAKEPFDIVENFILPGLV